MLYINIATNCQILLLIFIAKYNCDGRINLRNICRLFCKSYCTTFDTAHLQYIIDQIQQIVS